MLVALMITFVAISNCINHLVRFSGEHIGSINRSINCRLSVNQHCFAVSHFGFTYTHSCMFFFSYSQESIRHLLTAEHDRKPEGQARMTGGI